MTPERGRRLGADLGEVVGGEDLLEPQREPGQRRAQLVGRLGRRTPLALEQLVEARGGPVEHVGDSVELGDAVALRHRPAVAVGDAGRGRGEVLEGPCHAPRVDVGHDHGDAQRDHRDAHDEQALAHDALHVERLGDGGHDPHPAGLRLAQVGRAVDRGAALQGLAPGQAHGERGLVAHEVVDELLGHLAARGEHRADRRGVDARVGLGTLEGGGVGGGPDRREQDDAEQAQGEQRRGEHEQQQPPPHVSPPVPAGSRPRAPW
jgi:hypothetical protein